MSYYIKLDKDGNEFSRELKGRGRPRKGYEKREDGNHYLVTGEVSTKKKAQYGSPETGESENKDPKEKVDLAAFLQGCVPIKGIYKLRSEFILSMHGVYYKGKSVGKIKNNDVWSYVSVNTQDNTISLWLLRDDKQPPSHIITNVFTQESLKNGTDTLEKFATVREFSS